MKRSLVTLAILALPLLCKGGETTTEIARRVIKDKTTAYITPPPHHQITGVVKNRYRDPNENRLVEASTQSEKLIESYIEAQILDNKTPESVLLAYAIHVLKTKRIPWEKNPNMLGIDTEKNQGYLDDGLKLAARLDEIVKPKPGVVEQPSTQPESKPESGNKPESESEGRSR